MPQESQNNRLSEGIALYRQKKYADALTSFLLLVSEDDVDEIELSYYLGLCYSKTGRYDEALSYLEKVVTEENDAKDKVMRNRMLQCRYLLAVVYIKTGRNSLADYELKQLADAGYRPASVYASLAYIAWQQEKTDLCIELYQKSLEIDKDNVTALNGLGYVLAEAQKDLAKALSLCKKALTFSPDSSACLDSIGWVYYNMGLPKESLKYLRKALEKDRDNETIQMHLRQVGTVE